jgi:hypothetical protein
MCASASPRLIGILPTRRCDALWDRRKQLRVDSAETGKGMGLYPASEIGVFSKKALKVLETFRA